MQLQLHFARRVRRKLSLNRYVRTFCENPNIEAAPVEENETEETEEVAEENESEEPVNLKEEEISEVKTMPEIFRARILQKGKYAVHENRLVRVVDRRGDKSIGTLNMWETDEVAPTFANELLVKNIEINLHRSRKPKRKPKMKQVKIPKDDPWIRLGQRAEVLIGKCNRFTEKFDQVIATALELPQALSLSTTSSEFRPEGGFAIDKEFADLRKFYEELYKDYFLVDIANSTVVPESGDPEYYFVIQLKLLLGDQFCKDDSYYSEVRLKSRMLKESLERLAGARQIKSSDENNASSEWNLLIKRFEILVKDLESLNQSCRSLIEDYESIKTETTPDSPRNEFEKSDEVRYWVPAMKQWVQATVEEVVPGDSNDQSKRGKIKLSYERAVEGESPKKATKWVSKWHSNVQPLPTKREAWRPPLDTETNAIKLCSYFQSVKYDIPIDAPLRLPKFYHEIDDIVYPKNLYEEPGRQAIPSTGANYHLMQQYYLNQYLPASHPARLRYAERNGRDPYQDAFIQRSSDSSRIMNSEVRFDYYDGNQPLLGGDQPMLNFWKLAQYKRYDKFRIAIHKAQVDYGKHKENYEMRIFRKYAYNFKITSNRTMDMFNARGFDMKYATKRIL